MAKRARIEGDSVEVKEILSLIKNTLLMYEVAYHGRFYVLDPYLNILTVRDESIQEIERKTHFISTAYANPPEGSGLKRLRMVDADLANSIVWSYLNFSHTGDQLKRYLRMGMYPNECPVIHSLDHTCLDFICSKYNANEDDLYKTWLYYFLRRYDNLYVQQTIYVNYLYKICYWKKRIMFDPNSLNYSLLSPLYGGERAGLMLIALARNRPKRENIFAQFPRDLVRMIFDWVEWSLPDML
jgi:hypothetical protein